MTLTFIQYNTNSNTNCNFNFHIIKLCSISSDLFSSNAHQTWLLSNYLGPDDASQIIIWPWPSFNITLTVTLTVILIFTLLNYVQLAQIFFPSNAHQICCEDRRKKGSRYDLPQSELAPCSSINKQTNEQKSKRNNRENIKLKTMNALRVRQIWHESGIQWYIDLHR